MAYSLSGLVPPPGVSIQTLTGAPVSEAMSKYNISQQEIDDMVSANGLDPSSVTTVVQIKLISNATGEYSSERLTFTLDASAILAPGQALRIMRKPRGSAFSSADVGAEFAVGPFGNGEGVAGRIYRVGEPSLPMNVASGAGPR